MNPRLPLPERRSQLIDSALAVAAEEGIAATTVRRVAEQAGVALGVVHYCFADKDELFVELAARIIDDLVAAGAGELVAAGGRELVEQADPDQRPSLAGVLGWAVDGLWTAIERSPGAQLLTYEITTYSLRQPGLGHVAARQYEASQAAVLDVLGLAAAASGTTWTVPVEELAGQALAYLDGVTLRWLVDRDSAAARARLASFAAYLGTQAKPVRRRRAKAST